MVFAFIAKGLERLLSSFETAANTSTTRRDFFRRSAQATGLVYGVRVLAACASGPVPKPTPKPVQPPKDEPVNAPNIEELAIKGEYEHKPGRKCTWKGTEIRKDGQLEERKVEVRGLHNHDITMTFDEQERPIEVEVYEITKDGNFGRGTLTQYIRNEAGVLEQVTILRDTVGTVGVYDEVEMLLFDTALLAKQHKQKPMKGKEEPWKEYFLGHANEHLKLPNWAVVKRLTGIIDERGTVIRGELQLYKPGKFTYHRKGTPLTQTVERVYEFADNVINGNLVPRGPLVGKEVTVVDGKVVGEHYSRDIRLVPGGVQLLSGKLETIRVKSEYGGLRLKKGRRGKGPFAARNMWIKPADIENRYLDEQGRLVRIDIEYDKKVKYKASKKKLSGEIMDALFAERDFTPGRELKGTGLVYDYNGRMRTAKKGEKGTIYTLASIYFDAQQKQYERTVQQHEPKKERIPRHYVERYHRNDEGQITQVTRIHYLTSGKPHRLEIEQYKPRKKWRPKKEEKTRRVKISKRNLVTKVTGSIDAKGSVTYGKVTTYERKRRKKKKLTEKIEDGHIVPGSLKDGGHTNIHKTEQSKTHHADIEYTMYTVL